VNGKAVKLLLVLPAFSIVFLNAIAQKRWVEDWASVWTQEKQVLAQTPIEEIRRLPPDSRVLYIGPSYYREMVIFGASWDITGAVFSLSPLNQSRKAYQRLTSIHPATTLYNWTWDGTNLIQDCPGNWTVSYPAARMFVWNYDQHRMFEAERGFRWAPVK